MDKLIYSIYSVMSYLPEGYRMQPSSEKFRFDIVTGSANFKKYQNYAEKHKLFSDISVLGELDQEPDDLDGFLKVIQKSPLWLKLRLEAAGTASAVGKLIKGPTMYPTTEQITELWRDKILQKPFDITHTVRGHMKWGVGYEDPALIHFAVDNNLAVTAVGTIYLPMSYLIDELMTKYLTEEEVLIIQELLKRYPQIYDQHFLVSPDGLVGRPGAATPDVDQLLGMLEIKCISPFHHMEEDDGSLTWCEDMEKRQWHFPGEIPYVYVTQICMQAMSGLYRLDMTGDDTMWFIRWSPIGFSEFKIGFTPLVQMGLVSSVLYLALKQRITTEDDLPFHYKAYERPIVDILRKYYKQVINMMTHRYVEHTRLYPEFQLYRELTEYHRFIVNEKD